jgi:hypothetical protein
VVGGWLACAGVVSVRRGRGKGLIFAICGEEVVIGGFSFCLLACYLGVAPSAVVWEGSDLQ